MNKVAILAIKYAEPEWQQQTLPCLLRETVPVTIIDRNGTGSLAEAINRGVKAIDFDVDFIWVVTNITWKPGTLENLLEIIEVGHCAAVHPAFDSDHSHLKKKNTDTFGYNIPFVEFTAPLVRSMLLQNYTLDEDMPYWGHDLDWGHRIRNAGWDLSVDYTANIGHTYIRNNKFNHPVTLTRQKLRKNTDASTRAALVAKYGDDWAKLLKYPNDNS
jgi:GT2 family glycosyltransferase